MQSERSDDCIVIDVPVETASALTAKTAPQPRARRRNGRHAPERDRLPERDESGDQSMLAHEERRSAERYYRVPNSRSLSRR